MNQIEEVISKVSEIMTSQNFIGIGSTRKVYRYKNLVVKKNLHKIGHLQSIKEQEMFRDLNLKGMTQYLAPVLHTDEKLSIQPFYEPLPLKNGETYNIELETDDRSTNELREVIEEIDKKYDGFDLLDSGNYGLDQDGKLILIDYGMTKKLYENEWAPLATAGILPQIYFESCQVCGREKELRIYGENDSDRRCLECGKE
ncbi:protein kinase [Metaplanococcus flavidus]|uniref:Protein kinase n=1 Tax=Metaplanococcus flavidus TaxID=569883 RepID=A0ABW3LC31_9BACL